jgi:hypothetical protein
MLYAGHEFDLEMQIYWELHGNSSCCVVRHARRLLIRTSFQIRLVLIDHMGAVNASAV